MLENTDKTSQTKWLTEDECEKFRLQTTPADNQLYKCPHQSFGWMFYSYIKLKIVIRKEWITEKHSCHHLLTPAESYALLYLNQYVVMAAQHGV